MSWTDREKAMVGVVVAVVLVAAALVLYATWRVQSTGRIKAIGVGIYADVTCTIECHEVDWGTLNPGDLAGITVYIKNTRNTNFTLTMNTTDWTPTIAETYLTFDWNYSGEMLEPGQIIIVQLTMFVDPNIQDVTDFSHDINITAEEV